MEAVLGGEIGAEEGGVPKQQLQLGQHLRGQNSPHKVGHRQQREQVSYIPDGEGVLEDRHWPGQSAWRASRAGWESWWRDSQRKTRPDAGGRESWAAGSSSTSQRSSLRQPTNRFSYSSSGSPLQ